MGTSMRRRSRRRVPAVVTALVVLLTCAGLVAFGVRSLLAPPGALDPVPGLRLAAETSWGDPRSLVGGGCLLAVGLLLLAYGLWPGRSTVFPLAPGPGLADGGITGDALRRLVGGAVVGVGGVTQAQVVVRRGTITITAWCRYRDLPGLEARISDRVVDRLDQIGLRRRPGVRIRRIHGQP